MAKPSSSEVTHLTLSEWAHTADLRKPPTEIAPEAVLSLGATLPSLGGRSWPSLTCLLLEDVLEGLCVFTFRCPRLPGAQDAEAQGRSEMLM